MCYFFIGPGSESSSTVAVPKGSTYRACHLQGNSALPLGLGALALSSGNTTNSGSLASLIPGVTEAPKPTMCEPGVDATHSLMGNLTSKVGRQNTKG